jgi:hypothetical protein
MVPVWLLLQRRDQSVRYCFALKKSPAGDHFRKAAEMLFALAQYIYSLEPPPNPNAGDPRAAAGRRVFDREGCGE